MRREGKGASEIARAVKRDKSTVSRELRRNSCARFYRASTAQQRYAERRKACRRRAILDDGNVFGPVGDKFLEEQWSPEQIEGHLALELGSSPVSDTPIYRGIHAGRFDGCIGGRAAKRRLGHRGKIPVSHEISQCPPAAEGRSEPGHWEGDTVAGKAGGAQGSAAGVGDARPGQGVRRARPDRRGARGGVLLRAAAPSLAARHQREHQRALAGVLPEGRVG